MSGIGLERSAVTDDSIGVYRIAAPAGGAKSGAPVQDDADLAAVITAWPRLPADVKAEIAGMIEALRSRSNAPVAAEPLAGSTLDGEGGVGE